MAFTDTQKRMVNTLFFKFGVAGSYNSNDVTIIVNHNLEINPGLLIAGISEKVTALDFKYEEVPNPKRGDIAIIGGTTYKIEQEFENDGFTVRTLVK